MEPNKIQAAAQKLFTAVPTLSLSTTDDDGYPHATNLNFVADEAMNLFFISAENTAHSRHVAARPRVAASAYARFEAPGEIRGIQLHGTCSMVAAMDFEDLWQLYKVRFPYAVDFEELARREKLYRITPTWLRWIDNSEGFGFKAETTF